MCVRACVWVCACGQRDVRARVHGRRPHALPREMGVASARRPRALERGLAPPPRNRRRFANSGGEPRKTTALKRTSPRPNLASFLRRLSGANGKWGFCLSLLSFFLSLFTRRKVVKKTFWQSNVNFFFVLFLFSVYLRWYELDPFFFSGECSSVLFLSASLIYASKNLLWRSFPKKEFGPSDTYSRREGSGV